MGLMVDPRESGKAADLNTEIRATGFLLPAAPTHLLPDSEALQASVSSDWMIALM